MKNSTKKYYLIILLGVFALPFIFQINIFPFVQYGMYANKPEKAEYFSLLKDGEILKKEEFPLPYSILNYLLRKENYNNNLENTLIELHQLPKLQKSQKLLVLKIEEDTTIVFRKNFE